MAGSQWESSHGWLLAWAFVSVCVLVSAPVRRGAVADAHLGLA